jgi:DNA polymerase
MNDLFADVRQQVNLAGPTDLAGFRRAARLLVASRTPPEQVAWHTTGLASDASAQGLGNAPPIGVGADFMALCKTAILHSNPARFELLYRLLWRIAQEPDLQHDPLDADMLQAEHLAKAVRRDMHKMKAFVRFRTVADETFKARPTSGPLHVAWFEPEHHIVEAIAPFFARRFTQMRWAILTPERCMAWNGAVICFSPGAQKSAAPPADAGEALWLTYYQNTFNPARLKLNMMRKEMPRRYWHNLPETQCISAMTASAHERHTRMIEDTPSTPHRRIPAFKKNAEPETGRLLI